MVLYYQFLTVVLTTASLRIDSLHVAIVLYGSDKPPLGYKPNESAYSCAKTLTMLTINRHGTRASG